jgi:hypothetical protein
MLRPIPLKLFIYVAMLSLAMQVAITAHGQTGFEGAAPGPFTVLQTPEGNGSAADDHAQINTKNPSQAKPPLLLPREWTNRWRVERTLQG